jgi:hypothetical protein
VRKQDSFEEIIFEETRSLYNLLYAVVIFV